MWKLPTLVALSLLGVATAAAERPTRTDTTSVVVQNNRNTPVRVYIDFGNEEITLGSVKPLDVATFVVPRWFVNREEEVNIFVQPQNGLELQTGYVDVRPGAHLGIIVPDHNAGFPRIESPDD